MRVLELSQGHRRSREYHEVRLEDALLDLKAWDEAFFAKYPKAYRYPQWQLRDVGDNVTVACGYEWYRVNDDGRLTFHSAHYDSSG